MHFPRLPKVGAAITTARRRPRFGIVRAASRAPRKHPTQAHLRRTSRSNIRSAQSVFRHAVLLRPARSGSQRDSSTTPARFGCRPRVNRPIPQLGNPLPGYAKELTDLLKRSTISPQLNYQRVTLRILLLTIPPHGNHSIAINGCSNLFRKKIVHIPTKLNPCPVFASKVDLEGGGLPGAG
jgi:hypothetical protein